MSNASELLSWGERELLSGLSVPNDILPKKYRDKHPGVKSSILSRIDKKAAKEELAEKKRLAAEEGFFDNLESWRRWKIEQYATQVSSGQFEMLGELDYIHEGPPDTRRPRTLQ